MLLIAVVLNLHSSIVMSAVKSMAKTTEEKAAARRAYYLANKHKWKESYKRTYAADPGRYAASCAKWRAKNRAKLVARSNDYRKRNLEKVRAANRIRDQRRRENDIAFRLKKVLRCRMLNAIRRSGTRKNSRTQELLGCDIEFFRGYLEARFQLGMSWDNYGEWHIDHRIPCKEFDLTDSVQQKQCFHYSNLQPLWAADNFRKNAKLPEGHQAELV